MFFNELKYFILSALREKRMIFWLMIFPMLLGTLFKLTMSDLSDKQFKFKAIPTAVVEESDNSIFHDVVKQVSEGDDALLNVTFTDKEKAEKLLNDGEVEGIITSADTISLTVSGSDIEETVLKSFTDRYLTQEKLMKDAAKKDPAKLPAMIEAMSADLDVLKEEPVTKGSNDRYLTYFYNLLAMVAACSSVTGLSVVTRNEADQSALGARKCCSPTPKLISTLAVMLGCWAVSAVCMLISVTFLTFVLKVDFGDNVALVYAAGILGSIMGSSMGFMIASLVRGSYEKKNTVAMIVSLGGNFLSGLMIADIKPVIMEKAPMLNTFNPAAVICDCLYYLNIDSDLSRYSGKMVQMLVMAVAFTLIGFVFTRRRKYASI
ncbi:ABC transporter permease [Ruminococcus albus]|uniref:ABC-2 type transport system permease protein n=1 Tax=Ruminococcus albus TaxID=1264 RepID=A0A1I1I482_RUMAL|nr:ABC transporter permease [Ruminococcus albus]SFC29018.1 ABC-2 type transport system permease protein [Ruminococcus albus]